MTPVSIPDRYSKNETGKNYIDDCVNKFQFLIGTLKTRSVRRASYPRCVSIPDRYSKNSP